MEIFGWVCTLFLAMVTTFGIIVGGYIQYVFGGLRRSEWLSLFLISIVPVTLWYTVVVTFPFIVGTR